MKSLVFPSLIALVGLASIIGFETQSVKAEETQDIQSLKDPQAIEAFRENFLKNFKRIGLNTAYNDAQFLRIMVESSSAKRGLEIGSCNGYGAMFMGMGFERNGGQLVTLEIDPKFVKECRENLKKTGLEKTVECVEGDALKTIPELQGEFDFVFIDAQKQDYYKYFKAVSPKLKAGAVIVADNVIQYAEAMKDFLDAMKNDPAYDTVIIQTTQEKRDGMSVTYKRR
ncbi:MAG: O-methyltransferase [Candidatus Omnitrophota bacterium]